jgi:hypothetical protein
LCQEKSGNHSHELRGSQNELSNVTRQMSTAVAFNAISICVTGVKGCQILLRKTQNGKICPQNIPKNIPKGHTILQTVGKSQNGHEIYLYFPF